MILSCHSACRVSRVAGHNLSAKLNKTDANVNVNGFRPFVLRRTPEVNGGLINYQPLFPKIEIIWGLS